MADRTAPNNIYTVLAFVAALVLLFGVIYVCVRYSQVFTGLPFTAKATALLGSAQALGLA